MEIKTLLDETRKQLLEAMGFSLKAISILDQGLNMGVMDNPTVQAQHQGTCGDILMLSLRIDDDQIKDARYEYIGCAGLQACASAMTELIKDQTVTEAGKLEVSDIIHYLESIPEQKYECAEIAHNTLRQALERYGEAN
jgi:nitrogen fixation protein NifU and related proteins